MSKNTPDTIPSEFTAPHLQDAYRRGWNHGHGFACHNVPRLGAKLHLDDLGRVTVDAGNIREVHAALCYAAEANSRSYSPFEITAHEFNSAEQTAGKFDPEKEGASEALWEAFEAGTSAAIGADLESYTDADYGIDDAAEAQRIHTIQQAGVDLYEALKSAMVILEAVNGRCTNDTVLILNCRAAIAKAEGGAAD